MEMAYYRDLQDPVAWPTRMNPLFTVPPPGDDWEADRPVTLSESFPYSDKISDLRTRPHRDEYRFLYHVHTDYEANQLRRALYLGVTTYNVQFVTIDHINCSFSGDEITHICSLLTIDHSRFTALREAGYLRTKEEQGIATSPLDKNDIIIPFNFSAASRAMVDPGITLPLTYQFPHCVVVTDDLAANPFKTSMLWPLRGELIVEGKTIRDAEYIIGSLTLRPGNGERSTNYLAVSTVISRALDPPHQDDPLAVSSDYYEIIVRTQDRISLEDLLTQAFRYLEMSALLPSTD